LDLRVKKTLTKLGQAGMSVWIQHTYTADTAMQRLRQKPCQAPLLQSDCDARSWEPWFPTLLWSHTNCGPRTVTTHHLTPGKLNIPNIIRSKVWKTRIDI